MFSIGDFCEIISYVNRVGIHERGTIIKRTGNKFMLKIGYYNARMEWCFKFKAHSPEELELSVAPHEIKK